MFEGNKLRPGTSRGLKNGGRDRYAHGEMCWGKEAHAQRLCSGQSMACMKE